MADILDKAQELEEMERAEAIKRVMRTTGNENLTGRCQWCGEPAHGIVCSRECREDMNKAERMKR